MPKVYYEPKDKKKYKKLRDNWKKTYSDYPNDEYVDSYPSDKSKRKKEKNGNGCIITLLLGIFLILFIPVLIQIIFILGLGAALSQQ